ncbi:MAG: hypothetical protein A3C10_03990 [Candidatus Magasanikbacteria bacterium RIFCSPHIGHO2_02_FULL_48_18]|nr:MAG: hypothetical protein A3C10_03990 [Candidatus Magasanikbacteria bacterium RIFCSPHIGHO2_02_FULL_48_18]
MFRQYFFYYSIIIPLCIAGIWLGMAFATPLFGILGAVSLLGCIGLLGKLLGKTVFSKNPYASCWGVVCVTALLIILHGAVYVVFASTPVTILATFAAVAIMIGFLMYRKKDLRENQTQTMKKWKNNFQETTPNLILFLLILLGQTVLFVLLLSRATTGVLPSPWLAVGPKFFLLYGITTAILLFYQCRTANTAAGLLLITLHFFLTFGVATVLYPLGFGYDPFLHRAAEQHIFDYGFIAPKTPFYIGQYVIVNILTHITHIPITILDIFLTPLLASLLLPFLAVTSLRHGFGISDKQSRFVTPLLLFFPLTTMIATTPHNLANLFFLLVIFAAPLAIRHRALYIPLVLLSVTSAMIHILPGIFALLFSFGLFFALWFEKKKKSHFIGKKIFWICCGAVGSLVIPLFFLIYQRVIQHLPLPSLSNIPKNINHFFSFFKDPYYFSQEPVAWLWDALYLYRKMIIPIILLIALLVIVHRKKTEEPFRPFFRLVLFLSATIVVNAFFTSTWLTFPDLHVYDQLQYAGRLLHIAIYPLLPLFLCGIVYGLNRIATINFVKIPISILFAVFLTGSFYLLYPQSNPKVVAKGYNVTSSDMAGAAWIHNTAPSSTAYIVLSPILTAAASIEQFGFERYYETGEGNLFYYSIPTGSPLYKAYLDFLYQGQKKETVLSVLELTRTNRAYVVVPRYWDDAEHIIFSAKQSADGWQEIGNGEMWIFTFNRPSS